MVNKAGLVAEDWTSRELRRSFVSLLSDNVMPIEQISRLTGHNGTAVTELVHRHQLRPIVEHGAEAMDRIFGGPEGDKRHRFPAAEQASGRAGLLGRPGSGTSRLG